MIDPIIASKPKVAAINVDIAKDATLLQSLPLVLTTAQIGQSRRLLLCAGPALAMSLSAHPGELVCQPLLQAAL
ncbi:MAG: hypothetical protein KJ947_03005 [Alphaproteobacteria bacterium]|nr:hypothetical protein [Alphaproteobacteria bacterium]MBU1548531.1 hypothetical protein [Alphaproteobacteria bacterium]MBU2337727.1 hypothetical protein [Alphaproteobacteria bacterium]MBU2389864.1 hypothetical protein [Alphaproteobacteria bacterium]